MAWDYAAETAWHQQLCSTCSCARDQHEDDGCYGGCAPACEQFG